MKARTFIITTSAIFALAAPAAQASLQRMLPVKHVSVHSIVVAKVSKAHVAKPAPARTTPLYIYVPAPLASTVSDTSTTASVDSSASTSADSSMTADDSEDC